MHISPGLEKLLLHKSVLVDTCVLSTIKNNAKSKEVQDLIKYLEKLPCSITVSDLIKVEFLRDANKESELFERKELLEKLCENFVLPVQTSMHQNAMILSYIYAKHKNQGVDFVDLMNSALVKHYAQHQGLILMTENHKDFPLSVHTRLGTAVLDLGKTLSTIGFYIIDIKQWDAEVNELLNSKQWKRSK